MNREKKCSACESGRFCPCSCEQCKSPTSHSTGWEARFHSEIEYVFGLDHPTYGAEGRREMEHVKSFIRTTVDEAYERGKNENYIKVRDYGYEVGFKAGEKQEAQKERERILGALPKDMVSPNYSDGHADYCRAFNAALTEIRKIITGNI